LLHKATHHGKHNFEAKLAEPGLSKAGLSECPEVVALVLVKFSLTLGAAGQAWRPG
jgi:hypothetical protein